MASSSKPHAVCLPFPAQSHIKAILKLAKLLHHKGFYITFVNTEFNHKRFLKSLGPNFLHGFPDFRFETIPDGIPDSDEDSTQDLTLICQSALNGFFLAQFRDLLIKLNGAAEPGVPPVTCIVSDGALSMFTITVAEELGIPISLCYTIAASSFMGIKNFRAFVEKGLLAPLKDESCQTNGYLDKIIDWIPGIREIRLRDLPISFQSTDPNDVLLKFSMEATDRVHKASSVVFLTFDALEQHVLDALSSMLPNVYTIGPIQLLLNQIPQDPMGYSLWKEDTKCLQWLNSKPPNTVVYVNFGSITVMKPQHLVEFGWGLANTKLPFVWVVRPDLVIGESAILPSEFADETKERGLISSWCPQEEVLNHPSVGGFLTHSGWNSTIESLSAGVPMICWPSGGDQQTNCYYTCNEWGCGMEIDKDVKREEVEKLVRVLMEGEKGKEMRSKAKEWKKLAEMATHVGGSSSKNFENLVGELLLRNN